MQKSAPLQDLQQHTGCRLGEHDGPVGFPRTYARRENQLDNPHIGLSHPAAIDLDKRLLAHLQQLGVDGVGRLKRHHASQYNPRFKWDIANHL
jgi:hypothetical protein